MPLPTKLVREFPDKNLRLTADAETQTLRVEALAPSAESTMFEANNAEFIDAELARMVRELQGLSTPRKPELGVS